jgi:hypothetical protein
MTLAHKHRSAGGTSPFSQPPPYLAMELDPDSVLANGLVARYPRLALDQRNLAPTALGSLVQAGLIAPFSSNTGWGVSPYSPSNTTSGNYLSTPDTNGVLPSSGADSTQSCWIQADPGSTSGVHAAFVGWGGTNADQARELRCAVSTTYAAMTNYNVYISNPAGPVVLDNKPHHLVGVIAGGLWSVYVDGVLVTGPTAATTSTTASTILCVGTLLYVNQGMVGAVDNVSIWNRALSGAEIAYQYLNPYGDLRPVRRRPLRSITTSSLTATTWNPIDKNAGITLSNGNLTATGSAGSGTTNQAVRGTTALSASTKQYFEVTATKASRYWFVGVMGGSASVSDGTNVGETNGICFGNMNAGSSLVYRNGAVVGAATYATVNTGDVIRVAVDRAANKVWWAINNTPWTTGATPWLDGTSGTTNDPATGTGGAVISAVTGTIYPAWSSAFTSDAGTINGGATAFAYAVPAGFVALDTGATAPTARRPLITMIA